MRYEQDVIILKNEEVGKLAFDGEFQGIILVINHQKTKRTVVIRETKILCKTLSCKSEYLCEFELKENVSLKQLREKVYRILEKKFPDSITTIPKIAITEELRNLLV